MVNIPGLQEALERLRVTSGQMDHTVETLDEINDNLAALVNLMKEQNDLLRLGQKLPLRGGYSFE